MKHVIKQTSFSLTAHVFVCLLFCCCCYIAVFFLYLLDDPVDDGNGVYHLSLKGQQVMQCALEFQPSEVQTKLALLQLPDHVTLSLVITMFCFSRSRPMILSFLSASITQWPLLRHHPPSLPHLPPHT